MITREELRTPRIYMSACMKSASADAVLVLDDGSEFVAHAAILRRMFGTFANIMEDTPMESGLWRVPVRGHNAIAVAKVLFTAYHIACLTDLLESADARCCPVRKRDTITSMLKDDLLDPDVVCGIDEDDLYDGTPRLCTAENLKRAVSILGKFVLCHVVGTEAHSIAEFVKAADFLELLVLKDIFANVGFRNYDEASEFDQANTMYTAIRDVAQLDTARAQIMEDMYFLAKIHQRCRRVTLDDVRRSMRAMVSTNIGERAAHLAWLMRDHDRDGAPCLPPAVMMALCEGSDVHFGAEPPVGAVTMHLWMLEDPQYYAIGVARVHVDSRAFTVMFESQADDAICSSVVLQRGAPGPVTIHFKVQVYDREAGGYMVTDVRTIKHTFTEVGGKIAYDNLIVDFYDFMKEKCDPFGTILFFAEVVVDM